MHALIVQAWTSPDTPRRTPSAIIPLPRNRALGGARDPPDERRTDRRPGRTTGTMRACAPRRLDPRRLPPVRSSAPGTASRRAKRADFRGGTPGLRRMTVARRTAASSSITNLLVSLLAAAPDDIAGQFSLFQQLQASLTILVPWSRGRSPGAGTAAFSTTRCRRRWRRTISPRGSRECAHRRGTGFDVRSRNAAPGRTLAPERTRATRGIEERPRARREIRYPAGIWRTNIAQKRIPVGELFTVFGEDGDDVREITHVTTLAA